MNCAAPCSANSSAHYRCTRKERATRRPTAEQILRLFSHTTRSVLRHKTEQIRRFDPELTDIQRQILTLLMVPLSAYRVAT